MTRVKSSKPQPQRGDVSGDSAFDGRCLLNLTPALRPDPRVGSAVPRWGNARPDCLRPQGRRAARPQGRKAARPQGRKAARPQGRKQGKRRTPIAGKTGRGCLAGAARFDAGQIEQTPAEAQARGGRLRQNLNRPNPSIAAPRSRQPQRHHAGSGPAPTRSTAMPAVPTPVAERPCATQTSVTPAEYPNR